MPDRVDNCSAVEVAWFADTLGLPSSGMYTVLNTFLASDACGNTTTHTQVVTHVDATPPSWTFVPADSSVQCGEAIPVVFPQATDNCSEEVLVEWLSDDWNPGDCGGTGTWARTFQATDVAGNDTLVVQHIAVLDTVAPVFSATSLTGTLSCVAPWPEEVPAAEDGCGVVSYMTTVDSVWVDSQWTLNFTHVATDECLNSALVGGDVDRHRHHAPGFHVCRPRRPPGLHRQPSPVPGRGGRRLRRGHLDELRSVE